MATAIAVSKREIVKIGINGENRVTNYEEWSKGVTAMLQALNAEYLLLKEGNITHTPLPHSEEQVQVVNTTKVKTEQGMEVSKLMEVSKEESRMIIMRLTNNTHTKAFPQGLKVFLSQKVKVPITGKEEDEINCYKRHILKAYGQVQIYIVEGELRIRETADEVLRRQTAYLNLMDSLKGLPRSWWSHLQKGDVYALTQYIETQFNPNRKGQRVYDVYEACTRLCTGSGDKFKDIHAWITQWVNLRAQALNYDMGLPDSFFVSGIRTAVTNLRSQHPTLHEAWSKSVMDRNRKVGKHNLPEFDDLTCNMREWYVTLQDGKNAPKHEILISPTHMRQLANVNKAAQMPLVHGWLPHVKNPCTNELCQANEKEAQKYSYFDLDLRQVCRSHQSVQGCPLGNACRLRHIVLNDMQQQAFRAIYPTFPWK